MVETNAKKINGFLGLLLTLAWYFVAVVVALGFSEVLGIIMMILGVFPLFSLIMVQPNEARVVIFFGKYIGTVRDSGFWMIVPLSFYKKISLRIRNFNSNKLKVNDVNGNPIEIAAVVVFKVVDSAKAVFDVDSYEEFVEIQSETALRHVATKYPYDCFEDTSYSLRSNAEEISYELTKELQSRLALAGVEVVESRLTHLAYATEIASAMLQRQQAAAILAARKLIVEGAVSMAQSAIQQLQEENVAQLSEERKVAMINNLLVAIVSDRSAQPVINTGSIE
jgi:regulator of protease activity HflC (stomatin/prohibitin superfamily)